jgi:hypothetical protein
MVWMFRLFSGDPSSPVFKEFRHVETSRSVVGR